MSYWISRKQCNNCGSEVNVTGGMVGTMWMGPSILKCPNPNCGIEGFDNFTTLINNIDTNNPEHREFTIRNNHEDHSNRHNGPAEENHSVGEPRRL